MEGVLIDLSHKMKKLQVRSKNKVQHLAVEEIPEVERYRQILVYFFTFSSFLLIA